MPSLGNPVDGVKRPAANSNEGSTPALGDAQARRLLEAPAPDTLKGVRDRAILATLLYHGIRREELCLLRLRDMQSRQGVMHFRIKGKRDKIRFVPVHPMAQRLIGEYLAAGKHGGGHELESGRPPLPAREEQPHRHARQASRSGLHLPQHRHEIWAANGHQRRGNRRLRAFDAGDGGDECAFKRGGYRQGAGMAGPRQCLHYPALRPAQEQAGGQPDVSCEVLSVEDHRQIMRPTRTRPLSQTSPQW